MAPPATSERTEALRDILLALMKAIEEEEADQRAKIDAVLPKHRASAVNLVHYLALRKQDIHRLQLELAALGLSSLGRCEGHVRDTLLRILAWLSDGHADAAAARTDEPLDWAKSESILHANTRALLGPRPHDRHVYIMVTAPDASQANNRWADSVIKAGANLLRINGAHESPREWKAIVATYRSRAAALDKPARVFVDLPGPKLRTEVRKLEEAVLHLPRRKDRYGRTVAPTEVLLVAEYSEGAQIPVPPEWLPQMKPDDTLELMDSGERERALVVRGPGEGGVRAACSRSLYVTPGLELIWRRGEEVMAEGRVGKLPRQPGEVRLAVDDAFLLNEEGQSADLKTRALAFPEAQLLAQVKPGERVILDDGKLVAIAEAHRPDGLLCRVQYALKSPARLRSGKGIAFPDSELSLKELGPNDEVALAFALEHADGVGVSFVNSPRDVALIGSRVRQSGKAGFGMILKLETRGAMRHLAGILLEALKYDPVGLMIARGDLAVELSFERLAEMQEELLWFGEAGHLPVVWATQVLDTVAHTGIPTRAEVTDAAMAMRAECVMLNKGPFVAAATRMLADIIRKMEAHQYKKRSLYRRLAVAHSQR